VGVGNIATLHTLAGDTDLILMDPNGKVRKRVKNVPEHGLAMDGAGNVYLSDEFGGQIEVIDPQGNVVLQINGASGTRFGYALWQENLYGPPVDISQ